MNDIQQILAVFIRIIHAVVEDFEACGEPIGDTCPKCDDLS